MHAAIWSNNVSPALGRTRFRGLLIARALISREDLAFAERHAVREQIELAETLVALGLVTEGDAFAALACAAAAPLVVLDDIVPEDLAVSLVPEPLARHHLAVPLEVDPETLTYATCRPFTAAAQNDLALASGRRTRLMVASRTGILAALDRTYPKPRDVEALAWRRRMKFPNIEATPTTPGRAG